ncbi:uncharacterized protein EI90DRAFT_2100335 [Cantharellus anzutake]|uniref:uncharacterized protein n=1 Tax=Cantharellus anzutake TaxID=1750568 RepID=UPI0019064FD7|nr:uncharacterized protein EI90DRAFT_2100335 [Cantharellus anzutake]KAF8340696.1 hypothetical protein EI90DRAFT_2100335 [Cantharellus anzutake]
MTMRTFEDIPNEIILHIAQDVSSPSELISLTLTSRRLRGIAETQLYRSVSLKDRGFETGDERQLRRFVHTLILRPELRPLTRHLDILWYGLYDEEETKSKTPYAADKSKLIALQTLAREKGMSACAVFDLEKGWCRPYFSLLMHILPSLESLVIREMDCDVVMATRWTWRLSGYHGPLPIAFQSLRSLGLSFHAYRDGLRTADVVPFMSLPALNSFRVSQSPVWDMFPWWTGVKSSDDSSDDEDLALRRQTIFRSVRFTNRSSKLKKLELSLSVVNPELLDCIFQTPEALDILIYHNGWGAAIYHGIDPPAFCRALRHQLQSLTTLCITISGYLDESLEPMGTLSDFISLKTLSIPCLYLFGPSSVVDDGPQESCKFFDLLPPNLLSVTIGTEGGWNVEKFVDAVGGGDDEEWRFLRSQRLPHLEEFILTSGVPNNAAATLEMMGINFKLPTH